MKKDKIENEKNNRKNNFIHLNEDEYARDYSQNQKHQGVEICLFFLLVQVEKCECLQYSTFYFQ